MGIVRFKLTIDDGPQMPPDGFVDALLHAIQAPTGELLDGVDDSALSEEDNGRLSPDFGEDRYGHETTSGSESSGWVSVSTGDPAAQIPPDFDFAADALAEIPTFAVGSALNAARRKVTYWHNGVDVDGSTDWRVAFSVQFGPTSNRVDGLAIMELPFHDDGSVSSGEVSVAVIAPGGDTALQLHLCHRLNGPCVPIDSHHG